jgi:hypothetical protein
VVVVHHQLRRLRVAAGRQLGPAGHHKHKTSQSANNN